MEDKNKEPGIHSVSQEIPAREVSVNGIIGVSKMPGVEIEHIEEPGKEPTVRITVNTMVLPQKGKKK